MLTIVYSFISTFQLLLNFGVTAPLFIVDEVELKEVMYLTVTGKSTKEPGFKPSSNSSTCVLN